MERLVERQLERNRNARCSRWTLPNVPIGSFNCLLIEFSCPVKRVDSAHPETEYIRMFSLSPIDAQVLPNARDLWRSERFACSVLPQAKLWRAACVCFPVRCAAGGSTALLHRHHGSEVRRHFRSDSRYSGVNPAISNLPD